MNLKDIIADLAFSEDFWIKEINGLSITLVPKIAISEDTEVRLQYSPKDNFFLVWIDDEIIGSVEGEKYERFV